MKENQATILDYEFPKWYKKFLKQPLTKQEKSYLKLIPKNSKEGKLFVTFERIHLMYAYQEGYKLALKVLGKYERKYWRKTSIAQSEN